jgi:6-phosphogluconolactonase
LAIDRKRSAVQKCCLNTKSNDSGGDNKRLKVDDPMKMEYIGFVGCYTKAGQADPFEASHGGVPHDRTKIGKGVLAIGVDSKGKLSFLNDGKPIIAADELPNPSYLCILGRSESKSRPAGLRGGGLCIVSEVEEGRMHSFAVSCEQKHSGMKITALDVGKVMDSGGAYPCHIISSNVGSDMECLLVSNYGEHEGVLSVFRNGSSPLVAYTKDICIPFGPGSKVDPNDRQASSHAHSTSTIEPSSPSSLMDLCCADLGSDAIVQFSLTTDVSSDGKEVLKCIEKTRVSAPPGSGPRSLSFNPVHNIAVVSLEMSAQVWLINRRQNDGQFESMGDPVSVLPENWPDATARENEFNNGKWVSDAVWSPDGKFVYAAARLHNSISVFHLSSVEEEATSESADINVQSMRLRLVQRVSTEGITPRCLCMSDCGKCLLVVHQHSHDVSSFQRNESDGMISFVNKLEVANAACVKLIRPKELDSVSLIGQ